MTGPLSILIIGSDTQEQQSLEHAFRSHGVSYRHFFSNEDATLRAYFQKGLADAMFVPTLIMLDQDACQPESILALLKHHPVLRRIPVIIFGQGDDPERVKQAYQLGATCYMPKPSDWNTAMAPFCSYWKKRVALPAIKAEDIISPQSFSNRNNRQQPH
ncbi:hypothetical protein ACO2Q8_20875 [Larkinella sp. VNQ87]|uniref:hypothetical protein n=1 Tax=Larkinella sp. VNQ87 TaxID=3400921 RepID=UPI003C03459F